MSDVYEVPDGETAPAPVEQPKDLYKIYGGARIAISAQVGPRWKRMLDATIKAYEEVHAVWDNAMRYYNFVQDRSLTTSRGVFKRGDGSENIIYANINTMLPAVYSKDPDIAISTTDQEDEPFCKALQSLLNTLIRRRDKLNAKHKIRRACGFGMMTNQGILKLDFTLKNDSREFAASEMARITQELAKAKTQEDVQELYGQLHALEQNMEVFEPSGPALKNVLPHKLFCDPSAENPDGLDGMFMIEEMYMNTAGLNARFTEKKKGKDEPVMIYAPTHKAIWAEGMGERDDGLGLVMSELDRTVNVTGHTSEEREAAIQMHYTMCYLVWDKATRRVMLFHKDDWKWPIWVWDDPHRLSRFFPYFIVSFGFSTGGVTSPGEVAYYLDQQDEINDINRQVAKIRRTIFDCWLYNSDTTNKDEAEKMVAAIRGEIKADRILGVRAGENKKVSDMFETLKPPSVEHEAFFNKEPILKSVDRLTNTNDAIRGAQFKTNTTEDAVQTYQEAARLAVGAKVDVLEDVVADMAYSLAELCIQHYSQQDVADLIGATLAEGWQEMTLEQFRANVNITLVAGSMEKPNSIFKKKEAVQIAQAVGQFAQAAPGSALKMMVKVLEKAFTEVTVTADDWKTMNAEIEATMQKGISTGGAQQAPPPEEPEPPTGPVDENGAPTNSGALLQRAMQLPTEIKAQINDAKDSGLPQEQLIEMVQSAIAQVGDKPRANGQPKPA